MNSIELLKQYKDLLETLADQGTGINPDQTLKITIYSRELKEFRELIAESLIKEGKI